MILRIALCFAAVVWSSALFAQVRCSPDGFGGQRCTNSDGSITRMTPDGFGGSRITGPDGGTTRVTPDGFGGN